MAGKYYAVKAGRKPGIYRTWDDCKSQVHGFSGAIYKSFASEEDAEAFMAGAHKDRPAPGSGSMSLEDIRKSYPGIATAYVDGSFNSADRTMGSGVVLIRYDLDQKSPEILEYRKTSKDKSLESMRNVAGEIGASELAMDKALELGIGELVIVHDYEGIARWPLGDWKTNREGTRNYRAHYESLKDRLAVHFVKVKGHSGDRYNDMADALARQASGVDQGEN